MKKPAKVRLSKIVDHQQRPFTLSAYDPDWKKQYELKAAHLRQILEPEVVSIEHVGSTAVNGMMAKPQIDILVTVHNLAKIKAYYEPLAVAGFSARGDYTGEGEEYFTEDDEGGKRLSSIHVLPEGHVWAQDLLNVRDYLRSHPAAATAYSASKQTAYQEHGGDYNAYYRAKLSAIQTLRQQAADWRAESEN